MANSGEQLQEKKTGDEEERGEHPCTIRDVSMVEANGKRWDEIETG